MSERKQRWVVIAGDGLLYDGMYSRRRSAIRAQVANVTGRAKSWFSDPLTDDERREWRHLHDNLGRRIVKATIVYDRPKS